jgi:hypothetical protein
MRAERFKIDFVPAMVNWCWCFSRPCFWKGCVN